MAIPGVDPMNEISILNAQIDALFHDLALAERAAHAERIDPHLRERVRGIFAQTLNQRRKDLERLRESVRRGDDVAGDWARLQELDAKCSELFSELLAFVEGALVRSAGLDDGICDIADALLYDLAERSAVSWPRFTIMAEGELFGAVTEIIRLRFPHFSIWNLPVAAHELGHYVGPMIQDRDDGSRPFEDMLRDSRAKGGASYHRLHELFADLYAIYSLGPAYAFTSLLLRFNPHQAHQRNDTHPSFAERAHFILAALERVNESLGAGAGYAGTIGRLRETWRRSLDSAGQPRSVPTAAARELDDTLDELYGLVDRLLPEEARYDGFARAHSLSKAVAADDPEAHLQDRHTLPDVLNAAWLARIDGWEGGELQRISDGAMTLCQAITARGP